MAYLYPERKSKKEYIDMIKAGERITCHENTPMGSVPVMNGQVTFEGPHYPKPHKYYGNAWIRGGVVVWIE